MVDTVITQARHHGVSKVTLIKLSVGRFSGALPQALEFGFNAIKRGTELEKAQLVITEVDPLLYCSSCQHTFTPDGWSFVCEKCGTPSVQIIKGKELTLDYFEGT
jgi:hydrogenase nickel incorporation protein HypA/HybF